MLNNLIKLIKNSVKELVIIPEHISELIYIELIIIPATYSLITIVIILTHCKQTIIINQ